MKKLFSNEPDAESVNLCTTICEVIFMITNESNPSGRHRQISKISGALLILLLCGPVYAQPANDDCYSATVIPSSAPTPPYSDSVDATDATLDPADPTLSCNAGGDNDGDQTVWWEWTPSASGVVSISTFGSTEAGGSELDTAHGAFTGGCDALVQVACVDAGLTDELIMEVDAGTTYRIKVGQFLGGNDAGTVVLNVEEPPPPEQFVLTSIADGLSPPMGSLAPVVAEFLNRTPGAITVWEVPMMLRKADMTGFSGERMAESGLYGPQGAAGIQPPLIGEPADLLQIFDGAENDDNAFLLGTLIAPPDTNGDVGLNHYVQMTNLVTEIFDKSGNSVLGPFGSNLFFTGLGGLCENTNNGDPIVIYDEETDSWLVTQFAFNSSGIPPWSMCVAISTTGDPTGSYYQHEFNFSGIGFPDYPKWGFATDTISVMANLFSPFKGAGLGVIDKAEAMTAGPTTMVFFTVGASEFGFVPGDNDGPVFDNTPPTFFTNNGASGDRIDVWEITPDFAVPANTTIAEVAQIPVTPFDIDLCAAEREACIDQPGSGTGTFPDNITFLAAINNRLMHRGQVRDFGKRKKAMLSHTVDADGTGKAGVRWYELWNDKDEGWKLKKENTFSPDGDHRWMGSIAMNAAGQTCLGYSISSQTTYPSIGVAGRNGSANHMNVGELVAFDGNVAANVQTRTVRWGDYSAMAIDPVDDSCWYTQEYAKPNSFIGEQFGWATKIIQFDIPDDD
jgi:hypothetical protein